MEYKKYITEPKTLEIMDYAISAGSDTDRIEDDRYICYFHGWPFYLYLHYTDPKRNELVFSTSESHCYSLRNPLLIQIKSLVELHKIAHKDSHEEDDIDEIKEALRIFRKHSIKIKYDETGS